MTGIEDNDNYNDIKEQHVQWLTSNSGADILYYKQYRKAGKFIGCGDFTIDTKESMDKLLNKDEFKVFSFSKYTGINYKFNKLNDQTNSTNPNDQNNNQSAVQMDL